MVKKEDLKKIPLTTPTLVGRVGFSKVHSESK